MEVKVDSLIKQIKDKAIDEAKLKADEIISDAKRQANLIISNAKKESEDLLEKAEKTNKANKTSVLSSLEHSKRDVLLDLKKEIDNMFNTLLKQEIKESLTSSEFTKVITKLLSDELNDKKVEYNEKDFAKIKKYTENKLVEKLIKEKKIVINNDIIDGFAIISKNSNYYIDCSSEQVNQLLNSYLKESK